MARIVRRAGNDDVMKCVDDMNDRIKDAILYQAMRLSSVFRVILSMLIVSIVQFRVCNVDFAHCASVPLSGGGLN